MTSTKTWALKACCRASAELKTLVHDAVRDALLEVFGEDMSTEPNFAPEIAERLHRYRTEKPRTIPAGEAGKELGFDG